LYRENYALPGFEWFVSRKTALEIRVLLAGEECELKSGASLLFKQWAVKAATQGIVILLV
jgi:hypothetical protein